MADGDQERFEDYLELEKYIEALQADEMVHPPLNLTPEQIRTYQMVALFRSANDEDTQPRPEFIEQLKSQLLDLSEQQEAAPADSVQMPAEALAPTEPVPPTNSETTVPGGTGSIRRARFFSRRGLLTGGAIAAASLAIGAGVEHVRYANHESAAGQVARGDKDRGYAASQKLEITSTIPTTWHLVTSLANLGDEAVRFTSDSVIGYVVRVAPEARNNDTEKETIIALSAACTHMGCLVQWKGTERHFYCPCHGAIFGAQGEPPQTNYKYTIPPLPRLNTKVENGNIYVELPQPH